MTVSPLVPGFVLQWFALAVKPRHEKSVAELLRYKGYDAWLPIFTRKHRYGPRRRTFHLPLFPGYVFCLFDPSVRLPILTTPGVRQVVGAGGQPVALDEAEMRSLRIAYEQPASLSPHPFLETGKTVRITAGPFEGVAGTIVDVRQPVRLVLSITLLRRSVLLEINSGEVSLEWTEAEACFTD